MSAGDIIEAIERKAQLAVPLLVASADAAQQAPTSKHIVARVSVSTATATLQRAVGTP